jgi:tRNA dimethylallyltransferase
VGKTALSLALANRFSAEIVSVDSRQVYRSMEIGTAKPSPEELAQVTHHLIDVADPTDDFSLAVYLDIARPVIRDVQDRGKLPLLVGGTGQYLWALLEAWRIPSVAPDAAYRQELAAIGESEGAQALHTRLAQVDPDSAASIDPRNQRRVIRALEVHHQTGVPFSRVRRRGPEPYRSLILGLNMPRVDLYQRIDGRVDSMIDAGWPDEITHLLSVGVTPEHPSMGSVGYRDLAAHLAGNLALDDAIHNAKTATHRFARHQYAWFRPSDARIHWLEASEDVDSVAAALVQEFLASSG